MGKYIVFVVAVFFLAALACEEGAKTAKAELRDAKGVNVGTATLTETQESIKIALKVSDLPPGTHGFHIHTAGQCEAPDFKSAGGHFNPHGKKHGAKSPESYHAGDLANLVVQPDGSAKVEALNKLVTLGTGDGSLFQPAGTAIVIHADPDDEITDPTGNAGTRIACGIIEAS